VLADLEHPLTKKYQPNFDLNEYVAGAKSTFLDVYKAIISQDFHNLTKGCVRNSIDLR
jgi:hypothetical protein